MLNVENKFTLFLRKNLKTFFVPANLCDLDLESGALAIRAGSGSQNKPSNEFLLSVTTDSTWSTLEFPNFFPLP